MSDTKKQLLRGKKAFISGLIALMCCLPSCNKKDSEKNIPSAPLKPSVQNIAKAPSPPVKIYDSATRTYIHYAGGIDENFRN